MDQHNRRTKWFLTAVSLLGVAALQSLVWADTGALHQTEQARPIELGTSGGNINDISELFCCGGTLGSLVQDASGTQYILSNNHILANTNSAALGEDIIQPGLIDQNCFQDPNDVVANLSGFIEIKFSKGRKIPKNKVDAAIAQVVTGAVQTAGSILDISTVSANTVAAFPDQPVQKSGRTTGYTIGTVEAVDVTADVGYSKECGGPPIQVARFVNQIRITADEGEFSAGGDSGALVVESGAVDPTDGLPRAVGQNSRYRPGSSSFHRLAFARPSRTSRDQ